MADIKQIKAKLAALLARARDAGSSEAEVDACMKRAEKVMAEYGLTEADLKNVTQKDFREYDIHVPDGQKKHDPVVRYCGPAIARLASVTMYIKSDTGTIAVFGLDSDVEYALWMLKSLRTFMDDQWAEHKRWQLEACTRQELQAECIGFIRGYCETVSHRINDMVRAYNRQNADAVKTGTDLVVQKNDLVKVELKRRGINLGRGTSLAGRGHGSATGAQAGAVAGAAASLGRGVGKSNVAIGSR